MKILLSLVAVGLLGAPAPALAWGGAGHKTIAALAEARMTPKARARARQILAETDDHLVGQGFIEAAVWADAYRDSSAQGRATKRFHYANLDLLAPDFKTACPVDDGLALQASSTGLNGCILTKLNAFIGELGDPRTTPIERGRALRFIIHLVGDIHQPLHTADHGDAGGNCEMVQRLDGAPMSLHRYWDTAVVADLGRSPPALAAKLNASISPTDARAWTSASTMTWLSESYDLAAGHAYRYGGPTYCDRISAPTRLASQYEQVSRAIVATQLQKAGIRLAAVLNYTLG